MAFCDAPCCGSAVGLGHGRRRRSSAHTPRNLNDADDLHGAPDTVYMRIKGARINRGGEMGEKTDIC